MPTFSYTKTKGVIEQNDANTTGAFSVSDVAVAQSAVEAALAPIYYIRVYHQAGNATGGDSYAALEDKLIDIHDGSGNTLKFEFTPDGDVSALTGGYTAFRIDQVTGGANATASAVATALAGVINSASTTIHALVQTAVDGDDPADGATTSTNDYADIYIYGAVVGSQIVAFTGAPSTHIAVGEVVAGTAQSSIDAGVYLASGRADDDATVDTNVGAVNVGALTDGSRPGQTMFAMNNSTNRAMKFTGNFASGNTICTVDHGKGSLLMWNGSDWVEFKYVTGTAAFSS